MITKHDLRNLKWLIYSRISHKVRCLEEDPRTLKRKAKRGVLFKKQKPLSLEEVMLPVLRKTFPTMVRGEISSEFAMESDEKLGKKIDTPFNEIVIDGGPAHEFGRGFIDRPWRLIQRTGYVSRFEKSQGPSLKFIETTRVLDRFLPAWRIDLPAKRREEWQKKIDAHDALMMAVCFHCVEEPVDE